MFNSLWRCLWIYTEMVEVRGGVGGEDRTAQSTPPYLTHTPSSAQDDATGWNGTKGAEGEEVGWGRL